MEQPFRTCEIDADCVKPDEQISVISFVISEWLLPELSISAEGQKYRRLWGRECATAKKIQWQWPETQGERNFVAVTWRTPY